MDLGMPPDRPILGWIDSENHIEQLQEYDRKYAEWREELEEWAKRLRAAVWEQQNSDSLNKPLYVPLREVKVEVPRELKDWMVKYDIWDNKLTWKIFKCSIFTGKAFWPVKKINA